MANINRVVLVGNLTRDPELRHTPVERPSAACASPSTRAARTAPRAVDREAELLRHHRLGQPGRELRPVPRQGPAGRRSTAASNGASGTPRTAPSARRSRSSPTPCSSSAAATAPRRRRQQQPVRARGRVGRLRRRLRAPPTTTSRSKDEWLGRATNGRSRKRLPPLTGGRRKSCFFCKSKVDEIDYKNVNELRRYISEKGKIRSRRISGACRRHQRQVAVAVKRAREIALLPYVAEGRDDREGGGRRDRGDRGDTRRALPWKSFSDRTSTSSACAARS